MSSFISKRKWIGKIIKELLRWNELDLCKEKGCSICLDLVTPGIIWLHWNAQILNVSCFFKVFELLPQQSIFWPEGFKLGPNFQNSLRCTYCCIILRCFMKMLTHMSLWALHGCCDNPHATWWINEAFMSSLSSRWDNRSTCLILLSYCSMSPFEMIDSLLSGLWI